MRKKRSALKARQKRNYARQSTFAGRLLRYEPLETRVLLDSGGLFPPGDDPQTGFPPDWAPIPPLEPGAIHGRDWEDINGDRQQGSNEPGMGGVTVYSDLNYSGVLDAYEPSVVTTFDDPNTDFDEGGFYTLDLLQPGYHNVRQVVPSGFEQTFPSLPPGYLPPPWGDPTVHVTFVGEGEVVEDVDFGNRHTEPGSVHGLKWEDLNGDGVRDSNEPGLAGVVIFSDQNLNGFFEPDEPHTATMEDNPDTDFDETGLYWLEGLDPGSHWIKEVVPDGYMQTFPNYWLFDPALDPNIEPGPDGILPPFPHPGGASGVAHDVFIRSGEAIEGIDFGNQLIVPGSIHGVKWEDLNGDGVRSADELGLAGVTIYSDLNFNGEFDSDEPHAVTSADNPDTDFDEGGRYWFDVLPGFHLVREVMPDGYRQTFPHGPFPLPEPPFDALTFFPLPDDGAHFVSVAPGQAVEHIDFGNQPIVPGSIRGVKWEDVNGNAEFDLDEVGLPDVTIYVDRNNNGVLDSNEPHTVTMTDDPNTDFDEAGRYALDGLDPGTYLIREVVPDGFQQTFPLFGLPTLNPEPPNGQPSDPAGDDDIVDEFATVHPDRLDLELAPGDVLIIDVAITVHPTIFVPIEIDVFASSADVVVVNVSGPQLNGGNGDTSVFQIMVFGDVLAYRGELQFLNLAGGDVINTIPLTVNSIPPGNGAHDVTLGSGQTIDGIDFGNQPVAAGAVVGLKWLDLDGNGERGPNEPGLAGVTIYADRNRNGVFDEGEPSTVTMEDIPVTDFDEAGIYHLDLPAGQHWIAEVVPDGFMQTFPNHPVIDIFPPPPGGGVHDVTILPGQTIDGLDFGNRPIDVPGPLPGDLNSDGVVDRFDLGVWEDGFGSGSAADASGENMGGRGFLTWQRNFQPLPDPSPLSGDFNSDGGVDHFDLDVWEEAFGSAFRLATEASGASMDGRSFLSWQRYVQTVPVPSAATSGPDARLSALNLDGSPVGLSTPTGWDRSLQAIEAAFSDRTPTGWRTSQLETLPSRRVDASVSAMSLSKAAPRRDRDLSDEAFDAVLTRAFVTVLEEDFNSEIVYR